MHQLTIVEDDSPLGQKVQRAYLSEYGWEACGDVRGDARSEMPIIDFPVKRTSSQPPPQSATTQSLVVIKVDKKSRLLSYESHSVRRTPELVATVKAAVLHVLPGKTRSHADLLLEELGAFEQQNEEFFECDEPDAISLAAHSYRLRRQQEILSELSELKEN